MISREALKLLEGGFLSDIDLSSSDEESTKCLPSSSRSVRLGADRIAPTQCEYIPNDSGDEEAADDPTELITITLLQEQPITPPIVSINPSPAYEYLTTKQDIKWRHKSIDNMYTGDYDPPIIFDPQERPPIDYYGKYFTDQLFDIMVDMTNLYAVQSGKLRFKPITKGELEVLFGLHMATGVFNYPSLKMYWEAKAGLPLFIDNMTRDRFFELRSNLHVVDNTKKPTECQDVFYKVRPVFDTFRKRCLELPLEKELCVDEQMVPLTGKHAAKQYVKGKPNPWGLKLLPLCGKSGIVFDFILYQGSCLEIDKNLVKKFGYGAAVVLHLTKRIGDSKGHEIYFDNYFSSYNLLQILKERGIKAACTARINRFGKTPPLLTDKEMMKKPRGFSQEITSADGYVTLVKWMDNRPTNLASNFVGIGEADFVERWSKKENKFITVERPEVVKRYNNGMGGVDLLDQLMSYYRTFIKSKKWTLRAIFHASDLAVVQSFREYQNNSYLLGIPQKRQMKLLEFRRRLAESLIYKNKHIVGAKRGRPSASPVPLPIVVPRKQGETRPQSEVAKDGVGHLPVHDDKLPTRCKNPGCRGRSRIKCVKCNVHLCLTKNKNCYMSFHT